VAGLGPAQAGSSSRCQTARSTTVVANRVARVYRVALQEPGHVRYFACAYARGRTFHLAESRFVGEDTYGAVELAGNALAYSVALACRRCENSYARVYVHDVRSGRVTARTRLKIRLVGHAQSMRPSSGVRRPKHVASVSS